VLYILSVCILSHLSLFFTFSKLSVYVCVDSMFTCCPSVCACVQLIERYVRDVESAVWNLDRLHSRLVESLDTNDKTTVRELLAEQMRDDQSLINRAKPLLEHGRFHLSGRAHVIQHKNCRYWTTHPPSRCSTTLHIFNPSPDVILRWLPPHVDLETFVYSTPLRQVY